MRYVLDMARQSANQITFHDYRMRNGRGGPRKGAGRKPSGRRSDPKRAREKFRRTTAVHVTLRIRQGVRSLRCKPFVKEIRKSFRQANERGDFRLLHYSLQAGHVHLIVEADNQEALGRGMKSIGARIARAAQRVFGIKGRVISGAYHPHLLRTPREMYHALRYVLLNIRKHYHQQFHGPPPRVQIDEASSARWFENFSRPMPADRSGKREVSRPRSWLPKTGWKRFGPIDPAAIPGIAS